MWLFLARGLKVFFISFLVCTYGHARTATHVWARESEGTACVVVASGMRFESFFFACTATHVWPHMYGHTRTATHVRACESEGTVCVVVVSGMRFESFFFAHTATHVRARTYVRTSQLMLGT